MARETIEFFNRGERGIAEIDECIGCPNVTTDSNGTNQFPLDAEGLFGFSRSDFVRECPAELSPEDLVGSERFHACLLRMSYALKENMKARHAITELSGEQ